MTADGTAFLSSLLTSTTSDRAMQAAVDHVVASLGCDVSWTGEIEDDGHLHIRAHTGLRTTEMPAQWRLAVGEGIGGRAAALGITQQSSNYLHDSRRVPAKKMIDDEGIAAVLVAPLKSAGSTVGVLYAGQRGPRTWELGDIATLESAAHHLSVRFEQLGRITRTESELRGHTRRLVAADSALRSSTELVEALASADSIKAALELTAAVLNLRVELSDGSHQRLTAGPAEELCRGTEASTALGGSSSLFIRLRAAGEEISPADPPIRLALNALRLQVLRLRERETTREEMRGDLLERLLTGRFTDAEAVRRRLALIGLPRLAESSRVAVVDSDTATEAHANRFVEDVRATFPQSLASHRGTTLVLVLATAESEESVSRRLTELIGREEARRAVPRLISGMGRRATTPHEIAISFNEARAAHSVAHSAESESRNDEGTAGATRVISARSLGLQGLVSMPASQLRATVRDTLGPVLSHDATQGTDYLDTVRTYLRHDKHLGGTASELHLHYNTVRNRVARIEGLLELSFDRPDDRFRAETAVRMLAVLDAVGDDSTEVPPSE
ncbi:hypothetical protein A2T55_12875 [Brevibacterium linens]|uniref:GAF domain-containing protein n=1 Tax=Brevibacterium linens TaxID=1703 RepID=A0A142NP25_BRELN|nr:helix-turn-helix domain-containing protein [Brevibacterium linens]AMT94547.1 hypothetical protein A2T55_12875 [Brevibacterium linens]